MSLPVLFNRLGASSLALELPAAPAPMPARVDVAIIGGGIIGLSIGWHLAARGLEVAVFEARQAGSGASAAATGMLAAAAELEPGGEALLGLALESQGLWRDFRDTLEADAGQPIDYRPEGTLVVAVGRDETDRLRFRHELQRRAGLDTQWLPGSDVRALEPGLRPAITGGLFCPADHQVDPILTLKALRRAFQCRGGHLIETCDVDELATEGGRVIGVVAQGRLCGAKNVVLATGPVAGSAAWLPPELRLPVRPLKGQSLALRPRGGAAPLSHVLWTTDIHLAPKSDGRLILGATVEEAGFDPAITAGGVFALLDGTRRVLPGIEDMAVEAVWTGFRPTSDDDAPILGETPLAGLSVAAGHHRNGYLLAPVTAQAIGDLIVTGRMRGAAQKFGMERFVPQPLQKGAA